MTSRRVTTRPPTVGSSRRSRQVRLDQDRAPSSGRLHPPVPARRSRGWPARIAGRAAADLGGRCRRSTRSGRVVPVRLGGAEQRGGRRAGVPDPVVVVDDEDDVGGVEHQGPEVRLAVAPVDLRAQRDPLEASAAWVGEHLGRVLQGDQRRPRPARNVERPPVRYGARPGAASGQRSVTSKSPSAPASRGPASECRPSPWPAPALARVAAQHHPVGRAAGGRLADRVRHSGHPATSVASSSAAPAPRSARSRRRRRWIAPPGRAHQDQAGQHGATGSR